MECGILPNELYSTSIGAVTNNLPLRIWVRVGTVFFYVYVTVHRNKFLYNKTN